MFQLARLCEVTMFVANLFLQFLYPIHNIVLLGIIIIFQYNNTHYNITIYTNQDVSFSKLKECLWGKGGKGSISFSSKLYFLKHCKKSKFVQNFELDLWTVINIPLSLEIAIRGVSRWCFQKICIVLFSIGRRIPRTVCQQGGGVRLTGQVSRCT